MATITKRESGGWKVQVKLKGVRKSKTLPSKKEAQVWAARQEYLINEGESSTSRVLLHECFDRYMTEISPGKKGAHWEQIRLKKFCRHPLAAKKVGELTALDFNRWRDDRLKEVAPSTVNREMCLLSAVMTAARLEWGYIKENPLADVRKPKKGPPRDRRVRGHEIQALHDAVGPNAHTQYKVIRAFEFAIETAMRAGEIVGLHQVDVDPVDRVARLEDTKNGTSREVPLSSRAVEILEEFTAPSGPIFGLTSSQMDVLFRKTRDRAGIAELHFHDSRHEAITRLAKKLPPLDLARAVGHKNLNQLMTYYNATGAELARMLD